MAVETPIVTGYYRYTDIWFEWPKVLPESESDPLKAVLAHDALVDRKNPLHPDVQGISLFLGTFPDGQSRLLFSSAQVDYIRYWLHAMKLTTGLIPLPYSNCLLTSELSNVVPITYKDGGSLRGAVENIKKTNKRLKGSDPRLTARRDGFERVRKFWAVKTGTWCAVDFEWWEREHAAITEFGYSSIRWDGETEVQACGHFTVKERRMLTNGAYVPDHRNNYRFGASVELPKVEFKDKIHNLISGMRQNDGPLYLVFHSHKGDIEILNNLEAPLDGAVQHLPQATPNGGIFILDTAELFAALEGSESQDMRSLGQICNHLQISTEYLHNAGNDAYYTLLALREMASGEPLDTQREQRWPNQTGGTTAAGLKVKFKAHEEDPEYSDQEGVMGPLATGHLATE